MMNRKIMTVAVIAFSLVVGLMNSASAVPLPAGSIQVSWDSKLFNSDPLDGLTPEQAALLSSDVFMVVDGPTLYIRLQNTSPDEAGSAANVLLTGIGLNLPSGVTLDTDNMTAVIADGSSAIGGPFGPDISVEWGYDENPLESGLLKTDSPIVNLTLSALTAYGADGRFDPDGESIDSTPGLDGPNFGAFSSLETDCGGQEGASDSIDLAIGLSGNNLTDLVSKIDDEHIVLIYGSPNETETGVPDAGSTVVALGLALIGLSAVRRKIS